MSFDRSVSTNAGEGSFSVTGLKFVRGGAQLAVHRPQWNQTGHILTGWESREAYGEGTIREALEYGSAILRETPTSTEDAFVKRREDLGLNSHVVARAANVPNERILLTESQPSEVTSRTWKGLPSYWVWTNASSRSRAIVEVMRD